MLVSHLDRMRTKSYTNEPRQHGLRAWRDKGSSNDGSTLGSAIVVGNHPPLIEASATQGEGMSIQITSDSGAGRREGDGSGDLRAVKAG